MNVDRLFMFRADARIAASQDALRLLTSEERRLIWQFDKIYDRILEGNRTPGTTNKDRERFEQKAFDLVPGSKEARGKWLGLIDEGARARLFMFN